MPSYRKFSLLLLLVAIALALASCGTSTSTTTSPTTTSPGPSVAQLCPPGASHMGCALTRPKGIQLSLPKLPSGRKFPDVSSYQGHPNWAAAKSSISMAGVKAGEYQEDPDFAWNVSELKRLGIKWAPYWFVRNTGCAHEGSEIVSVIKSVGGLTSLPLVLDAEVPEAKGYVPCLATAVHNAFGRWPIVYTAPGTWPGGPNNNLPLWIADYNPSFPCMWTCNPVAWQFTDGRSGHPVSIPGVGVGDVSLDLGFSSLLPAPVNTHQYQRFVSGKFSSRWGTLNERSVVKHYDGAREHPAKYRVYLRKLRAELRFLAARDFVVAHRQRVHGKPSWTLHYRGWRYQQLIHRAEGRIVTA